MYESENVELRNQFIFFFLFQKQFISKLLTQILSQVLPASCEEHSIQGQHGATRFTSSQFLLASNLLLGNEEFEMKSFNLSCPLVYFLDFKTQDTDSGVGYKATEIHLKWEFSLVWFVFFFFPFCWHLDPILM